MGRQVKKYTKQQIKKARENASSQLFSKVLDLLHRDGRTNEELSEASLDNGDYVSPTTLYFWREGVTRRPHVTTVEIVAKVLGYELTVQRKKTALRVAA
jgi:hypothetical protein